MLSSDTVSYVFKQESVFGKGDFGGLPAVIWCSPNIQMFRLFQKNFVRHLKTSLLSMHVCPHWKLLFGNSTLCKRPGNFLSWFIRMWKRMDIFWCVVLHPCRAVTQRHSCFNMFRCCCQERKVHEKPFVFQVKASVSRPRDVVSISAVQIWALGVALTSTGAEEALPSSGPTVKGISAESVAAALPDSLSI